MGIRGAWSLLSDDPRRFGAPLLLSNEEETIGEQLSVFVDGPSLLYHVAVNDVYDQSPPLTQAKIQQRGSAEQASPATIYSRVTNFIHALVQVTQGHVHVVLDGLAPAAKMRTQIDRLRVMAIQGEVQARRPKSPCKLLHLLAESSMVEAVQDLALHQSRLSLHQPPRGEAETYIDCWIRTHNLQHVCILSDDSDFMVYSSCSGFIPFKTLEFHVLDGHLSLTGFHYQRTRLVSAFFSDCCNNERVMTTVAACAGCDYGMPDCFSKARTKMIQSDIGGLRPRLRNDPTSAAALTAILRYVAHWRKRRESDWLQAMVEALSSSDEEEEQLMVSLQEIHGIYFPEEQTMEVDVSMSVECRRLLECGVLYCRPLVETWDSSNEVRQYPSSFRKRSRKTGKRRRKRRQPASSMQDGDGEMNVVDNPPRETAIPFPPTQAYIDECLSSGSAWSVFEQVRARLYSVMRGCAQSQQQNDRHHFHPTWTSSNPVVTEYMRIGRGDCVDYVSRSIPLSEVADFSAILPAVLQCVVNEDQANVILQNKQRMEQDWVTFIASLMLPAKSAMLLLLLHKAPRCFSGVSTGTRNETRLPSLQESLLLMSVALFHASLLSEVWHSFDGGTLMSKESTQDRVSSRHIFRHEVAASIWKQMIHTSTFEDEDEKTTRCATDLMSSFFDQLNVSRTEELSFSESDIQTWQDETQELWTIWREISSKASPD